MHPNTKLNWRSAAILLLCAAASAACESALAVDEDPALTGDPDVEADTGEAVIVDDQSLAGFLQDGEERLGEGVTKFSEVDVAGTRLLFLSVVEPDTGAQSLLLLEGGKIGTVSLGAEPALADASLLDIFLAATEADVPVPDELLGHIDHRLGARGWFVDKVLRGEYLLPRSLCTNSDFQDALRDYTPAIDGGELWRLDSSPGGGNADWNGPDEPRLGIACSNCQALWYYHNYQSDEWPVANVDANKQAIKVCSVGSRPQVCASSGCIAHLGPEVQFWYRTGGNASTHFVWSADVSQGEYWRLPWTGDPTDNDRDWRFRIMHAVSADSFDIGYIWEHHGW